MAKNIWSGSTRSTGNWLLFSNGKTTMTGDGSTNSIVFIIREATDVNDEKNGTVTIVANGERIVKTITRCVPEVVKYWYLNLTADIDFYLNGEVNDEISPCKVSEPCVSPPCNNGIVISNIKMDKVTKLSNNQTINETDIPVSLNDINVKYVIDGTEYTYLPANSGNDRAIIVKLVHKTAKTDSNSPLMYVRGGITQLGLKGASGDVFDEDYFVETGYTSHSRLVINNVSLTGTCNPTSCAAGTCTFPSTVGQNLRVDAKLVNGSKTGKTICGDVITITPGGETPYPGSDWGITYSAVSYSDVVANFENNVLHYGKNTSLVNNSRIDVWAMVNNVQYGVTSSSNVVNVIIPPGMCGDSFSLVLTATTTSITFSQQAVTIKWYYEYNSNHTILTVNSDGIDARNCTTGLVETVDFVTFGAVNHGSDGISSVVATFDANQGNSPRYLKFLLGDDTYLLTGKTLTIKQSEAGLNICVNPTAATIPYTGETKTVDYFLSTGTTCSNYSDLFNYWQGLSLNCASTSENHCPTETGVQTMNKFYRKTYQFPFNESYEPITYTLTATCTNFPGSKTVTFTQEATPKMYAHIEAVNPTITYEGGNVVLKYYITETEGGTTPTTDQYFVNGIWKSANGEINKCKFESSVLPGECSFNNSQCLSSKGVFYNGDSVERSVVFYRFSLPANVSDTNITYTFKIGDNHSFNGKTGLTAAITQTGIVFNIKVTASYESVYSGGGTILLKWYVYTGSTAQESAALNNEAIKAGFWNYSKNNIEINEGSPVYWNELESGNYGVKLTGGVEYNNGIFQQSFKISANDSGNNRSFKFIVGHSSATNIEDYATVTQEYVSYFIHAKKDYNNPIRYDGKKLDGSYGTVRIYYYLSISSEREAAPITDENILFDENHNSYLDLLIPPRVNHNPSTGTGYSNGRFYKDVSFNENSGEQGINYDFSATCGHYNCVPDIVTIYQGSRYENLIPNCDYFIFTYSWEETDGHDLDSLTVLTVYDKNGNIKSFKDDSYNNRESSGLTVGWNGTANSRSITSSSLIQPIMQEYAIANTTFLGDYSNPYLKHSSDNTQSGAEGAVVNIKQILKSGKVADDDTIKIDIYGNWYGTSNNGNCKISYKQISGLTENGNYQNEILETENLNNPESSSDKRFYYSFSNTSQSQQIGTTVVTEEIGVLASGIGNISRTKISSGCGIKSFYTKLATLTFVNKSNSTTFNYGNMLPDYSGSGYNERKFNFTTFCRFDGVDYNSSNPLPHRIYLPTTGGTFTVENFYYKVEYYGDSRTRYMYSTDGEYLEVDRFVSIYYTEIGTTKNIEANNIGIRSAKVTSNGNNTYNITFEMDSYQDVLSQFGNVSYLDFYLYALNPFINGCEFKGKLASIIQFQLSSS